MLEDLRNHDALPTEEEQAWMAGHAVDLVMRSLALAAIAMTIGVSASYMIDDAPTGAWVAEVAPR